MRADRIPKTGPHSLSSYTLGKNRFRPGQYICSCGETLTGINAFESHRATALKLERQEKALNGKR